MFIFRNKFSFFIGFLLGMAITLLLIFWILSDFLLPLLSLAPSKLTAKIIHILNPIYFSEEIEKNTKIRIIESGTETLDYINKAFQRRNIELDLGIWLGRLCLLRNKQTISNRAQRKICASAIDHLNGSGVPELNNYNDMKKYLRKFDK